MASNPTYCSQPEVCLKQLKTVLVLDTLLSKILIFQIWMFIHVIIKLRCRWNLKILVTFLGLPFDGLKMEKREEPVNHGVVNCLRKMKKRKVQNQLDINHVNVPTKLKIKMGTK